MQTQGLRAGCREMRAAGQRSVGRTQTRVMASMAAADIRKEAMLRGEIAPQLLGVPP